MFPPAQGLRLNIEAISQILGSVSIACWIVVFSPQIVENWRRGSADGLSIIFIVAWLLGDFFNIFGAVLQGVLPTMIILAVYYTLADVVLVIQCFWYKGLTLRDEITPLRDARDGRLAGELLRTSERSPLLVENEHVRNTDFRAANGTMNGCDLDEQHCIPDLNEHGSSQSEDTFRQRYLSVDGTHLSPVTPLLNDTTQAHHTLDHLPKSQARRSVFRSILFNIGTIVLVCAAGVCGWYLSTRHTSVSSHSGQGDARDRFYDSNLHFNLWGQVFGYICAVLYLGSRVPQLLLNYRRKSTDGISMLFFLFACLGNLTYVLSIVVYQPICKESVCKEGEAGRIYARYIAVNFSWLLGSFGTLLLDAGVFVQHFSYNVKKGD